MFVVVAALTLRTLIGATAAAARDTALGATRRAPARRVTPVADSIFTRPSGLVTGGEDRIGNCEAIERQLGGVWEN